MHIYWNNAVEKSFLYNESLFITSNLIQYLTGLPLCMDTENTTQGTNLDPIENKPDTPHASWTGITYFLILLFSAFAVFVSIAYATKCFGKQNPQETPAHITLV